MAGRRKKDPITKEITGAKKRPEQAVLLTAEAPPMPDYFRDHPGLSAVWNEVVSELDRLNILSRTDSGTVEAYCITLERIRRLQSRIMIEGESFAVATKTGTRRFKNPDVDTLLKSVQQFRAYAIEMGCTPASRGKVPNLIQPGLFDKTEDNRWGKFDNRMN